MPFMVLPLPTSPAIFCPIYTNRNKCIPGQTSYIKTRVVICAGVLSCWPPLGRLSHPRPNQAILPCRSHSDQNFLWNQPLSWNWSAWEEEKYYEELFGGTFAPLFLATRLLKQWAAKDIPPTIFYLEKEKWILFARGGICLLKKDLQLVRWSYRSLGAETMVGGTTLLKVS